MEISKKLNHLLTLCAKQNFEFLLQKEGSTNRIYFTGPPENKLEINLGDVEDKDLEKILDEKIQELENLLK